MDLPFAILVVEDDPDCRSALCDLLELSGHPVFACADASSALEQARRRTPGLVMVDLHLPSRDGTWLVEALAGSGPPLSTVPVVLTTGSSDARAVAERLGVGVLEKPFDASRLLDLVDGLARRGAAERPRRPPPA